MHETALTEEGKRLFPRFAKFKEFYLVGGTGLALQIGHRLSVDFDFFSEKELSGQILPNVKRVFPQANLEVTYRSFEQLNVLINTIKTTFLYYPYPLIEDPLRYHGVRIATVSEIAAMKAVSIGRRLSYKDYVDWYFLLREGHVTLDAVIELSRKKYGGEFNARLFLGQLASVDDVADQAIDFLRDEIGRNTIRQYLNAAIRDLMDHREKKREKAHG